MKIFVNAALLLISTAMLAQAPQTQKSVNDLRDLAAQARSAGDLQEEAIYLCQAAAQDEKKYGKKCEKAKAGLTKVLDQFQADLDMGRQELQRKDYAGAVRDLGKITFGPNRQEAQGLMLQARIGSGQISPEQVSQMALQTATSEYAKGNFDRAEAILTHVQAPASQAAANQLLNNIHVYLDTMKQADAMMHSQDFKGAVQKYQFAITIQPNGPGQPQIHLREAQDAEEKLNQANAQQPIPPPAISAQQKPAPPPTKAASAAKMKGLLATAHRLESKGDLKGALETYEAALKLDDRQSDALSGKKRILDEMKKDPKAMQDDLTQAVTDFYASHFSEADSGLNIYLQGGGQEHAGAAHFFLGASLLSQALLADPKKQEEVGSLRKQAGQEFMLAKQLHYIPVESAVSPKILMQWTQTGDQQ